MITSSYTEEPVQVFTDSHAENRITRYMNEGIGILVGQVGLDMWHAVAFEGSMIYDPSLDQPYEYFKSILDPTISVIRITEMLQIKSVKK
jgi:hypothetical protein